MDSRPVSRADSDHFGKLESFHSRHHLTQTWSDLRCRSINMLFSHPPAAPGASQGAPVAWIRENRPLTGGRFLHACPEAQAASCCNNAEPDATEEAEGTSGRSTPSVLDSPQPEDAAQTQAPVPLDEDSSETAHTSAGDEPDDAKEEDLCPGHPHILRSSATCESKLAHESKRRGKTPARH